MMTHTEKAALISSLEEIELSQQDITPDLIRAVQEVRHKRSKAYLLESIEDMDTTFRLLKFDNLEAMNLAMIDTLKETLEHL